MWEGASESKEAQYQKKFSAFLKDTKVQKRTLTSVLGTKIALYIYEAEAATETVMFYHGNRRGAEYMFHFCEQLAGESQNQSRKRNVIAVDAPGYGHSSPPPEFGPSMEIVMEVHARAFTEYVGRTYGETRISLVTRSMGFFSAAATLMNSHVKQALFITPASFPQLAKKITSDFWMGPVGRYAASSIPSGETHEVLPQFETNGFDALARVQQLRDHSLDKVWVLLANNDALVEESIGDEICLALRTDQSSDNVRVLRMEGSHVALPGDGYLNHADILEDIEASFFE
jgi:pimeloyl-ACP methyl ester carboxylesterase